MTTTSTAPAPIARTVEDIDTALIEIHHSLHTVTAPAHLVMRDAMLAGVRGATLHLRFGRIERAAAIVDSMRRDLHLIGA